MEQLGTDKLIVSKKETVKIQFFPASCRTLNFVSEVLS